MQGALGIGQNLNKMSDGDLEQATRLTAFYKGIRSTVQQGNLYRLQSPEGSEATHVQYVSTDGEESVLFSYLHSQRYGMAQARVRLQGLDPKAAYTLEPLDPGKVRGELKVSGAVLMGEGLQVLLTGDYDSTAVKLRRVK